MFVRKLILVCFEFHFKCTVSPIYSSYSWQKLVSHSSINIYSWTMIDNIRGSGKKFKRVGKIVLARWGLDRNPFYLVLVEKRPNFLINTNSPRINSIQCINWFSNGRRAGPLFEVPGKGQIPNTPRLMNNMSHLLNSYEIDVIFEQVFWIRIPDSNNIKFSCSR